MTVLLLSSKLSIGWVVKQNRTIHIDTPAEILLAHGNTNPLIWDTQGYAYSALSIGLGSVFPRTAKHLTNF